MNDVKLTLVSSWIFTLSACLQFFIEQTAQLGAELFIVRVSLLSPLCRSLDNIQFHCVSSDVLYYKKLFLLLPSECIYFFS